MTAGVPDAFFQNPAALALLLVVPVLFYFKTQFSFRRVSLVLAFASGVLALSQPQYTVPVEKTATAKSDIMIAVDVSRSMLALDCSEGGVKINRLTATKSVLKNTLSKSDSNRIGLISFAGRPHLINPVTESVSWLYGPYGIGRLSIGTMEDGTAVGSAIAASVHRLESTPGQAAREKAVILITDGWNNLELLPPLEAAKLAGVLDIPVHIIVIGGDKPVEIQTPRGLIRLQSSFDEEEVRKVAEVSGGNYYRCLTLNQFTAALEEAISLQNPMTHAAPVSAQVVNLFHWPAVGCIALGLVTMSCVGRNGLKR